MPENQCSEPAQKRDVGHWAFHRLLPPITISYFTSRPPLCLNAFFGCLTSKVLFKLQLKLPLARDSDSNSAPRMKPRSSTHLVFLVAFQPASIAWVFIGSEDRDGYLSLSEVLLDSIEISSPSHSLSRPSPTRAAQRDDQSSDAMGVNAEFGWAMWPGTPESRLADV
ncbi:hypothetical protein B0H19DRAFT_1264651 [Mycena capillaripes]|nr:hypothetical protein B0H19DRAFT_1264651 [Mycena capillaripes]